MTDLSRHNGSDRDYYMALGALEQTVENHGKQLENISDKLDTLIEQSNKIKGGWITLSALVTVAAMLGEFSHSVIDFLKRVFS